MGVQLVGTIVLSRLLAPEDFGLVAMVGVFLILGELLRDFGIPTAALQARTLSHQQSSNLFWTNTLLGLVAGGALCAFTPLIVALYGEPRLAGIVPIMAATLLLNGAQAQVQVVLARAMQFTALAVTTVASAVLALLSAVIAAVSGWSYWSLVIQMVVGAVSLLLFRVIAARWRPSMPRRHVGTKDFLRSGGAIGLAQIVGFAASNADTVLIGSVWGATVLGQYNRAFQLMVAPLSGLLAPLTQVVIPTLNHVRDAGRSVFDLLRRIQFLVTGVMIPLLVIVAVAAPAIIPLLLGPGWEPAAHILRWLAIAECFRTLSYISYWGFLAERQSRQLLYYNVVTKSLTVALLAGAVWFGAEAVAIAYAVALALSWPINLYWLSRTASLPAMRFFVTGMQVLTASLIAGGAAWTLLTFLSPQLHIAYVALTAAIVLSIYAAILCVVPQTRRNCADALNTARRLVRRAA